MPYKNPEDQRAAARRHYELNMETYKVRAAHHRRKARLAAQEYLRSVKAKPCADCGTEYPYYVMQFDHLPGNDKLFDIGAHASRSIGMSKLREEVAKCEVVCANCHAERTHIRRMTDIGDLD